MKRLELKDISILFWIKSKIVFFIFIILLLLFLNYFYNLLLISKGVEFSLRYQYFLFFIFLGVLIISPFILSPGIFIRKSHLIFLFFSFLHLPVSLKYLKIEEELLYLSTTTLLPFYVFFLIDNSTRKNELNTIKSLIYLFIYFYLLRTLLYIVLIPLELNVSGKIGMHNLQFSGGQYHNIAILMLIILIIDYLISKGFSLRFERWFAWTLYVSTTLLSYSRVGLILLCLYILFFFFFIKKIKFKTYLYTGLVFILIGILIKFFASSFYESLVFQYWVTRLNIDLNSITPNSVFENIFNTQSNDDVRSVLLSIGGNRNLLELLFGIGIGATPFFLSYSSGGEFAFGSFHNFFGTIYYERGIIILSLTIFFFLYTFLSLLKKYSYSPKLLLMFVVFVIFISSTGAELFVNSRDFNIDMILCLLFFDYLLNREIKLYSNGD